MVVLYNLPHRLHIQVASNLLVYDSVAILSFLSSIASYLTSNGCNSLSATCFVCSCKTYEADRFLHELQPAWNLVRTETDLRYSRPQKLQRQYKRRWSFQRMFSIDTCSSYSVRFVSRSANTALYRCAKFVSRLESRVTHEIPLKEICRQQPHGSHMAP